MPAIRARAALFRAREIARWEGLGGLLRRGLRRILRPILRVRRFLFFEMDLTQPFPKIEARVPLEMRVATGADLDTFAEALTELRIDLTRAREQFERGDLLILTLCRGTLVNVGWIGFSSRYLEDLGVVLDLQPGESCGYGAVTHPDWRGLGILAAASLFRSACERVHGSTRHITWIAADNNVMLRAQATRMRRRTKTVWSIWVRGMRQPLAVGATREGSPSLIRLRPGARAATGAC